MAINGNKNVKFLAITLKNFSATLLIMVWKEWSRMQLLFSIPRCIIVFDVNK